MNKLGSVSRDILALVNDTNGYVKIHSIKVLLNNRHNLSRSEHWYRTRLTALAFEGHIEGTTFRVGDRLFLRYRRLTKLEEDIDGEDLKDAIKYGKLDDLELFDGADQPGQPE